MRPLLLLRQAGVGHGPRGPGVPLELLGQADDDALRATQEAEPVHVLVLRDLADELRTVAAQAGKQVIDAVDPGHYGADAERVRRRVFRLGSDSRGRVELRQLDPAVAVRGAQHGDVGTDVVEPHDAARPIPFDRRLAFKLHAEFGEERFGSLEVFDNDENVVHPLNRHIPGPQLTAFFTSAPIFFSSAALSPLSAKAVGHMAPSSRFALSLKPRVAYLDLNFCALWKKQTTLPSLAYAGIPYQVLGARSGALVLTMAWS